MSGSAANDTTNASRSDGEDLYSSLKSKCLREGTLYEDQQFPPSSSSLGEMTSRSIDHSSVVWRRPKDLISGAEFVIGDISRFDAVQGDSLANCWFISATASLAVTNLQLLQKCVPFEQSLTNEYAGIFHFYFWNFDEWVEIIIDDRLPTVGGQLIFAKNSEQPNEFWVPLFEKAYAKLKGNYGNLDGGQTTYALVDFTGGITERIDLKEKRWSGRDELFDMIHDVKMRSSMLGCEISAQFGAGFEFHMPNGLYRAHAYAVTNLVQIADKNGKPIKLIRIRNPWAEGEWNGRWSDKSKDWNSVTEATKKQLEMTNREEGEFWMSYEDWLNNFEWLTICHLQPDEFTEEVEHDKEKRIWKEQKHHSEWIRGFNAGGSPAMFNSRFWTNPQFEFTIESKAGGNNKSSGISSSGSTSSTNKKTESYSSTSHGTHVIVSLMQKSLSWDQQQIISFKIYQVNPDAAGILTADNYDKSVLMLAGDGPQPASLREVTSHFCLTPGRYVIIPYTLDTGKEAQFLLRIFAETEISSGELDIVTAIKKPEEKQKDIVREAFEKYGKKEPNMDALELTQALNYLSSQSWQPREELFTIEISRALISKFSKSKPWLIELEDMRTLYTEISQWMDKFNTFDRDKSGDVDTYELDPLLRAIDVQVSRQIQLSIVRRYGGKSSRISRQDFIHCCCRLLALHDYTLKQKKTNGTGSVEFSIDEYLATSLLL